MDWSLVGELRSCIPCGINNNNKNFYVTHKLHKKCSLNSVLFFGILMSGLPWWLRIHLPMQGTWVRSLVQADPTCHRAITSIPTTTEPSCHRAGALQQEKRLQWEAWAPQLTSSPHLLFYWRKPKCSNEEPVQPKTKINKSLCQTEYDHNTT